MDNFQSNQNLKSNSETSCSNKNLNNFFKHQILQDKISLSSINQSELNIENKKPIYNNSLGCVFPIFCRIAIYDNLKSIPRIIDFTYNTIEDFLNEIPQKIYSFSHELGGKMPFTILKEIVENLIHANFKDCTVSIMDSGNTIIISDHGPGISDKEKAFLPGFSSATQEMKKYIRGVGSGLPIVRETITFSGGAIEIKDNLLQGTVVSLKINNKNKINYINKLNDTNNIINDTANINSNTTVSTDSTADIDSGVNANYNSDTAFASNTTSAINYNVVKGSGFDNTSKNNLHENSFLNTTNRSFNSKINLNLNNKINILENKTSNNSNSFLKNLDKNAIIKQDTEQDPEQEDDLINLKNSAQKNSKLQNLDNKNIKEKNIVDDLLPAELSIRQKKILSLILELEELGPAKIAKELNFSLSTSYRELVFLESIKLVETTGSGKRKITALGKKYLEYYLNSF